jgi:hypothetical protein
MIKGDWKPRCEYKTLVDPYRTVLFILTRSKHSGPMLCIFVPDKEYGDHFHVCPMAPIFYGKHQFGVWFQDYFDEWMEIPE